MLKKVRLADTQIAAPVVKIDPEPTVALDVRPRPRPDAHAALRAAWARACAGLRCPRRSMSHSVL